MIDYWQGKLGIGFSFWVVFIGLLLLLSFIEPLLLKSLFADPQQRIYATLISLFITRLLIYPWQITGLIRALEKSFDSSLSTIHTRLIQALIIISLFFNLSYSIEIIQGAFAYKNKTEKSQIVERQPSYTLSIDPQKKQLHIRGTFEIGITNEVTKLIGENEDIQSVLLESNGGQIYEGRGLSILFTKHNLNTYIEKQCSSSCATAFIGGKKRYLTNNAKLGFHQYKLDYSTMKKLVPFHKPEEEQIRDLELFKSRGISNAFLEKVFEKNPDQMWFPSHAELLKAAVIHPYIPINQSENTPGNSTD